MLFFEPTAVNDRVLLFQASGFIVYQRNKHDSAVPSPSPMLIKLSVSFFAIILLFFYRIGNVVIIVASVASWLFWLCAWLHQWHPLIKPIYEIEE